MIVVIDQGRHPTGLAIAVAAAAAGWGGGALIVVNPPGETSVPLPDGAIVLEAPASDPDAAFATLVGSLAVRLDRGMDPASAFAESLAVGPSWTPVSEET